MGDRIDTDIQGAHAVGIDSFLVFTGAHRAADLLQAPVDGRPTAIGWDVAALLQPRRTASLAGDAATCGAVRVTPDAVAGARFDGDLSTRDAQLDALWALAQLVWAGSVSEWRGAVAALDQLL